jgi:sigma-B regulation protein RsbU (phosphoserine phosphatase)
MPSHTRLTKAELVARLETLEKKAARAARLQRRLKDLAAQASELETRCAERGEALQRECALRDRNRQALHLAEVILDKSPAILFRRLAGETPSLVYVSPNIRQLGYPAEDFLAGKIAFKDIVHPEDGDRLSAEIRQYAEADLEEYTQVYRVITRSGDVRWVEDQTSVVRDAEGRKVFNQGIVVDITERRLAEEALRKSEEKFRRIVETTAQGFILMDADLRIVYPNDAYCGMLGYEREEIVGKTPFDLATDAFRSFLAANRERLMAAEYRKFEGALVAKDGRVVPVLIHGNTLRDAGGTQIGNVAFVADLTEQKKALELAGIVQKSLIPSKAPRIAGLDIAGRSDPCEEVGGDYFDYLVGPGVAPGTLKVVVGDISGHGVDSALLMTTARAFIRLRAAEPGSPAQIVAAMNRDLSLDMGDSGHFMTLFYLEIDPVRRLANWVRAGHEPALVYRPREDRFEELLGPGLPLGIEKETVFTAQSLPELTAGMVIVLGTDGIWEATDPAGGIYGKARFRRLIREFAHDGAAQIVQQVFDDIRRFAEGLPPRDDLTLVVIKVGS